MTKRKRNPAFRKKRIRKWADFDRFHQSQLNRNHRWVYRGVRDSEWSAATSLERFADSWNLKRKRLPDVEEALVREFKRVFHHYSGHTIHNDDKLQWRALMQHHGAPTRLLDFTYSIHLAAYDALEEATGDTRPAIWAINSAWAARQSERQLKAFGFSAKRAKKLRISPDEDYWKTINPFFFEQQIKMVCPLNPFMLNERLLIQRGLFMCPGAVTSTFESNLMALDGHDRKKNVVVLLLPKNRKFRRAGLRKLFHMNLTRASIYPGLDGFARSLSVYHPTVVDARRA